MRNSSAWTPRPIRMRGPGMDAPAGVSSAVGGRSALAPLPPGVTGNDGASWRGGGLDLGDCDTGGAAGGATTAFLCPHAVARNADRSKGMHVWNRNE
jgi:hypothetical protein